MMYKLSELAVMLGGELSGEDPAVSFICRPEEQAEKGICIISGKKYIDYMQGAATSYVIPEDLDYTGDKPVIRVKDTRPALVVLLNAFFPQPEFVCYKSGTAVIGEGADISDKVFIGEYAVLGRNCTVGEYTKIHAHVVIASDVSIGKNCEIHPGVRIYSGTVIEDNVIVHSGAVIGGDGFGYIPAALHTKIPHRGNVVLRSHVEIGCNTTIDRGTIGSTVIGVGTKIDNLVQIGHNVNIGQGCLIASQTGISGSTVVGDYVMMGGQVGLADHINIGSFAKLAAKSGVHTDLQENGAYGGIPAVPAKDWARQVAAIADLPALRKRVNQLEKKNEGK